MTFLEAAIAILQREGKPLHYKKLTEIALHENLLTVVGKTPETTMQQRLADALKKNDPSLSLQREKPGIFGLRHYAPRREESPATPRIAPLAERPSDLAPRPAANPAATETASGSEVAAVEEGVAGGEERKRRRRRGGRGRRRNEEGRGEEARVDGARSASAPVSAGAAATGSGPELATDDATESTAAGSSQEEGVTPPAKVAAPRRAAAHAAADESDAPNVRGGGRAPAALASPPSATVRREETAEGALSTGIAPPHTAAPSDFQAPVRAPRAEVVPGVPRRHSFDAAAAEVAEAHRRASSQGGETDTASVGSETEKALGVNGSVRPSTAAKEDNAASADVAPAAAHEARPGVTPSGISLESSEARAATAEVHATAAEARSEGPSEGIRGADTPGEAAAHFEELADVDGDDDYDRPSGPMIATAFGTEELVRGEEHREVYDAKRARQAQQAQHAQPGQPGTRRDRPQRGGNAQMSPAEARRERAREAREARRERAREAREAREARRRTSTPPGAQPGAEARPTTSAAPPSGARPGAPPSARAVVEPRPPAAAASAGSAAAPVASLLPASSVPGEAAVLTTNAIDAVREVLRLESRPLPIRQIVEQGLRRKLLRGDATELTRQLRLFILVDAREREESGLRPRVRILGGGLYSMPERKLEGEVYHLEREMGERAARLADATRTTLQRRIARLGVVGFEAMMRVLLQRLGVSSVELVKRGDGVAYFGGERNQGTRRRKVLIALRPDDVELPRRAVGELRVGLKARGFDEGLVLAAGTAGVEAMAELAGGAGPIAGPIVIYDGEALASACMEHGVGSMRRAIPIEVLDLDFFNEISEP